MTAPILNRRFLLEAKETQPDGHGGFDESWAPLGTLWVELKGMTGRDRERESASLGLANFRITVRSAPFGSSERPAAGQRFREETRIFQILSVVDRDVEGRWLTCFCREEVVR